MKDKNRHKLFDDYSIEFTEDAVKFWEFFDKYRKVVFAGTGTINLEEVRNKGIYKKMLPEILEILKEQGFQKVTSMHSVTNNNVIVPKLKAGFVISGFEISDIFGLNLQLTYYFNSVRKKLVDYRIGMIAPDEQIVKLINPNK